METITGERYILRKIIVDSDNDTTWDVKDPKTNGLFTVHSTHDGKIFVKFFKDVHVSWACSYNAMRKICEIMVESGLQPMIRIHNNELLSNLFLAIGFRRDAGRHVYYLKHLR